MPPCPCSTSSWRSLVTICSAPVSSWPSSFPFPIQKAGRVIKDQLPLLAPGRSFAQIVGLSAIRPQGDFARALDSWRPWLERRGRLKWQRSLIFRQASKARHKARACGRGTRPRFSAILPPRPGQRPVAAHLPQPGPSPELSLPGNPR